jgi:Fur family peroxide stress response transcriptional regulator
MPEMPAKSEKQNAESRLAELAENLRKRNYRMTPQRMAVLKTMVMSDEHLSADQIYRQVRADFPMTSLATVYKTMAMLKEAGEVFELGTGGDGKRYDVSRPYPHPHLICLNCGRTVDPEISFDEAFLQEAVKVSGYRITSYRFELFGICPACQQIYN